MKPTKKQTDDAFQHWWNQTFFYTDRPFFEIYKKLFAAGADLEYLRFIHLVGLYVACFDPLAFGKQLRKSRKRKAKAISRGGFTLGVFIREMERLCFLIDCSNNPMVIAAEIKAMEEQLRQRVDAPTAQLFLKTVHNLLQMHVHMRYRTIQNSLEHYTSNENDKVPHGVDMAVYVMLYEILAQVCEKFFSLPRKGRQTDLLGNFVLFAVTEHLRQKRAGRPRHRLAAEFLRRITADSKKATAASTRVRVHKLNYSQNELLSFVNQKYALFRTIENFARQVVPD